MRQNVPTKRTARGPSTIPKRGFALLKPKCRKRVRMEAWRQSLLGEEKKLVQPKNKRTHLTPTGLLMEGDFAHWGGLSVKGFFTN